MLMLTFLNTYSFLDKIYFLCAFAGGVSFFIWMFLQFVIGGLDTDTDVDIDGEGFDLDTEGDISGTGDISFKLLSFQGLAAFLTMFGLIGLSASREFLLSAALSLLCAVATGLSMVWVLKSLFTLFNKLQNDGSMDMNKALGKEGTVYSRMSAATFSDNDISKHGEGQIQINIQGRLTTVEALNASGEILESDTLVKVTKVIGNHKLVVQKL